MRLYPPPLTSRSVTRRLAKDLPMSCRTRPIPTKEEKSWLAKEELLEPGRITLPAVATDGLVDERGPEVAAGDRLFLGRAVGSDDQVPRGRQVLEAGQRIRTTDEAVASPR